MPDAHPLRAKLAAGRTLAGIWSVIPSAPLVGALAAAGFDFVILDAEHGAYDFSSLDAAITACEDAGVPLLGSTLTTADFIVAVSGWLGDRLAPQTQVHGVVVDVIGIGVLLLGKSGIGKSETALDLVVRGHRLVADDVVVMWKKGSAILGTGEEVIRHHLEIRGLGIINIKDLFGIAAVRETKKIELVVELVEWTEGGEYDRLGIDDLNYSVLGVELPRLCLPVRPGRNLATLIEVGARNQLLKAQGHHSARELQERLRQAMATRARTDAVE
jgi:HPr kinase/phosphorylase